MILWLKPRESKSPPDQHRTTNPSSQNRANPKPRNPRGFLYQMNRSAKPRPRLSLSTLDRIPNIVRRPGYDVGGLSCGILHLGCGASHRAHQGVSRQRAIAVEGGAHPAPRASWGRRWSDPPCGMPLARSRGSTRSSSAAGRGAGRGRRCPARDHLRARQPRGASCASPIPPCAS